MPFDIENFSSYLCFVHPNKITLPPELDSKSFQLGVNPEDLSIVLDHLYKMYEPVFKSLVEIIMGSEKSNFKNFMKAVIARGVEISRETTTFAHFLLVCTLIREVVADSFEYANCFFPPNLCHYGLIAVYKRCYKEFFDSKEGTDETLDSCIESLKQFFETRKNLEEMINLPVFVENDVTTIMESLTSVEDKEFKLTEWEQRMLDEVLSDLPVAASVDPMSESSESSSSRGISVADTAKCVSMDEDCSDSTSKQSESSHSREVDAEDTTETASMEEDYSEDSSLSCSAIITDCSYYKHRVCDLCGSLCATLAVSYIEEIHGSVKKESSM